MDPSSLCSQGVTQSEAGLGNGGLNQGGSGFPFKRSGIDQVRPSLGSQLQKPFVETTNQVQILSPQPWQRRLQELQPYLQRLQQYLQRLEQEQERLEQERLEQLQRLQRLQQELQRLKQEEERLLQELQELEQELQVLEQELEQERRRLLQELQRLWLRQEQQRRQRQERQQEQQLLVQDAARLLLAQSRGSSIQASSPKVGVDSQDQEELTMEVSTIRSPPINPSPLYSQGVAQSKAGLVNGGLNQGGSGLPFKRSGIDRVRPSLGSQLQKPFVETTNRVQILSSQPRLQLQQRLRRLWRLRQQQELQQDLQWLEQELQQVLQWLEQEWLKQHLQWLEQERLDQRLWLQWLLLQELQLQQEPQLQRLEQEQQEQRQLQQELEQDQQEQRQLLVQDAARLLLAQSRGSSIQASSPKVGVDSQDQEELTMEASTIRSPPINPSPLYSQGVAQSKAGLINGGGSSFDDINGIESREKLCLNPSSPVDNEFDHSDEMGSDEINLIGSQTPKVKSKRKRKCRSSVWKFFKRITEKDGEERAQCIKCGVKYRIGSKTIGTSTLNRHVKKCPRNETHDVGQLEPKDQGPEPIQEKNIIEVRPLKRRCVPQAHISSVVQSWTTLSSPASGVLGTTPADTTKRRRLAEMHTESDKFIWSKTSAFRPTSHDSANKSAGTEADGGKSSTPPAATEEEVQAPRDLQLSLATTKSGPQEESGSVHKKFASAEELRSIGKQKEALKFLLKCILDWLSGILDNPSKGQIECLESCKNAVDMVLRTVGSAVDVKPLEAIFTELFASSKEWQSIQDPASQYQSEVLNRVAILRQELNEERELANKERSSRAAKFKQAKLYEEKSKIHKEILSSLDQLEDLDRAMLRELDEEQELENEEQSSWIDRCRRQLMLDMDKNLKHPENIKTEATKRLRRIEERVASKICRLKTFVGEVERILGVGLESAVPEVAAQKYAAHKREVMKAQLQDFSRKINDFFKE